MAKGRENLLFKRLLPCFLLVFLLGAFGITTHAETTERRVLFISSYSYAWDMTRLQIEGIRKALGPDIVLDYEFMDTKRVENEEALQMFHDGLKYRLEQVPPYDVVILGDDAALRFAMEYQEELFSGIHLVFEGVNDDELAAKAALHPFISGIVEKPSLEKNIELGLALNPKAQKVVAVLDDTITGQAERQNFYSYAEKFPELEFEEINASALTTAKLRQAIRAVSTDTILLYMSLTEDASGELYTHHQAVELLAELAKVPVFRMVEGGIGEGLLGGYVASMHESGVMAGRLATIIMEGADVSDKNVMLDSPNMYYLDAEVLDKFNLDIPELAGDVTILNERESFGQRYKAVLIPGLILLVGLACTILVVCVDNLRRRKLLQQLEESKKLIETASEHDFLTGIGNRSKFMNDLTELVHEKIPCTVFMMDIDNFKHINDTMGHTAGDEALQQLALRLKEMESQIMRPYRYAGDEFILILRSTQSKIVEKTAWQCRQVFSKPFVLDKKKVNVGGSIGIASYPEDTEDMEQLIIYADAAMYQVKKNGKNDFAFYGKKKDGEEA